MSDNPGFDYGLGQTNIDRETGIRYGVIPVNDVLQGWADSAEADYGPPHCPKCGNEARGSGELIPDGHCPSESCPGVILDGECSHCDGEDSYEVEEYTCGDYACDSCRILFDGEDAFGDTPLAFTLDDGEYKAEQGGDDSGIFIVKSPYYTRAQFCSPCAPGAGYLRKPVKNGPKTYCFGPDWFDEDIEPCPYPVYRVSDDECIYTPKSE
jgi:hypothetical protein